MTDLATTITVIDACGQAGVTPLLMSGPGMGKTSLVRGLATSQGVPFETVLGSISEPSDMNGLPVVTDTGDVRLAPPAWAKRLAAAGCGYVLLDELTTCPPANQAAMLGVALEHTVGDLRLPDEVRVVAAANPPDSAADGYELAGPMANRLCHIEFAPTVDEWIDGVTVGWSAPPASRAIATDQLRAKTMATAVAGYIRSNPQNLDHGPGNAADEGGAFPSRRTWLMLAACLSHVREDDTAARQALTFGLIGEGIGVEFLEWVDQMDLPAAADVVADPTVMDWNDRPDRVHAVLLAVVGWASSKGTVDAWRKAWTPLLAAADAGAPDVAATAARPMGRCRPAAAAVPAKVRKTFAPVLTAAGLGE